MTNAKSDTERDRNIFLKIPISNCLGRRDSVGLGQNLGKKSRHKERPLLTPPRFLMPMPRSTVAYNTDIKHSPLQQQYSTTT
eukprot:scaffold662_cov124-Skeletonema_dohrnii-CCMP3373.AAC.8